MIYIKNFNIFNDNNFYKIITKKDWLLINKYGLLPMGKIKYNNEFYNGNWTIPKLNIDKWTKKIKFFGSPLQALLMNHSNKKMVIIEININENNDVFNRNISKMFIQHSISGYYNSFSNKNIYNITESFITGEIENIKKINEFIVPHDINKYVIDINTILPFLLENKDIIYTGEKIISVKSALFKVLLKKIFLFKFKDF